MSPEFSDNIEFFSEDISFELADNQKVIGWLNRVASAENAKISALTIIFCSDHYLLNINQEYLEHDDFTDIITFDYTEEKGIIEGDIFISIDRVQENASQLNISFTDEVHRVLVHGVLHLLGYSDKLEADKTAMRSKEDFYLSLRSFS